MTLVFVPHYFSHQREQQQHVKSKQKKYQSDDDPCVSFSSFWSPLLDAVVVVEVVEIVCFDAAFPIFFFFYFFFFFSCDEDDDERVVSR